ncbi:MAG: hypothetical protein AB1513_05970 [Pseudomonadota bacterium]
MQSLYSDDGLQKKKTASTCGQYTDHEPYSGTDHEHAFAQLLDTLPFARQFVQQQLPKARFAHFALALRHAHALLHGLSFLALIMRRK